MSEYKSKLVCYYSNFEKKPCWAMLTDEDDYDADLIGWQVEELTGKFCGQYWIVKPKHFIFPAHSWEKIKADPKLKQEYEVTLMEQVNKNKPITITAEQRKAIRHLMIGANNLTQAREIYYSQCVRGNVSVAALNDCHQAEKNLKTLFDNAKNLKCDEI